MKITKELIAASSTPLVLSILAEGESYGYALIQKVSELSGNKLDWSEGMLYPVLHRLEEQGLIRSFWKEGETGRKRKYYSITAAGKKETATQKEQWEVVSLTLGRLWGLGHA